jgi:hypothetical protein
MDAQEALLAKIVSNQESRQPLDFDEEETRLIELLIEKETLSKKAFAIKRDRDGRLHCTQKHRADPFKPGVRARLGI